MNLGKYTRRGFFELTGAAGLAWLTGVAAGCTSNGVKPISAETLRANTAATAEAATKARKNEKHIREQYAAMYKADQLVGQGLVSSALSKEALDLAIGELQCLSVNNRSISPKGLNGSPIEPLSAAKAVYNIEGYEIGFSAQKVLIGGNPAGASNPLETNFLIFPGFKGFTTGGELTNLTAELQAKAAAFLSLTHAAMVRSNIIERSTSLAANIVVANPQYLMGHQGSGGVYDAVALAHLRNGEFNTNGTQFFKPNAPSVFACHSAGVPTGIADNVFNTPDSYGQYYMTIAGYPFSSPELEYQDPGYYKDHAARMGFGGLGGDLLSVAALASDWRNTLFSFSTNGGIKADGTLAPAVITAQMNELRAKGAVEVALGDVGHDGAFDAALANEIIALLDGQTQLTTVMQA